MFEQSTHAMQLERTYASGAEEWHCPTCGRRMILQWPPQYKKIVLEPGDEYAAHSGGTGGLQIGAAQIIPANEPLSEPEPDIDDQTPHVGDNDGDDALNDEALGPWLKWFGDADTDEAV